VLRASPAREEPFWGKKLGVLRRMAVREAGGPWERALLGAGVGEPGAGQAPVLPVACGVGFAVALALLR